MENFNRLGYLRIALAAVSAFCVLGVFPLTIYWPAGWAWHAAGHSLYMQMIIGIYATLGVFLIIAARNPLEHLSLIWFTVWSSITAALWRSGHSSVRSIGDISLATFPYYL